MQTFRYILSFVVGFFAVLFSPPAARAQAPANIGQQHFERALQSIWLGAKMAVLRGMFEVQCVIDRVFGMRTPFALADDGEVNTQILASLKNMDGRLKAVDQLQADFKLIKESEEERTKQLNAMQKTMIEYQKHQIEKSGANVRRSYDGLSDDCAKYLAGIYIMASLQQARTGTAEIKQRHIIELYEKEVVSLLGPTAKDLATKTAIATTDIPMPTGYSGDIVELVYQYGTARKFGTVFPLPNGTFKLPKLTTDPAFTLNAISTAISEKVPQAAFATFTAEKFGGLLRLPTEIEEDSIIPMGQFIARYVARNMALCEDYQFWRSTGAASGQNGTAEGLTKSVVTDSDFVYNGASSTSGKTKQSDATLADFRSMRSVASGAVLGMSAYYVHPTYEQLFCTFNTSATVTPYIANGINGASLDGFPIRWIPSMPAYSTGASASLVHALFGDVRYNYLGVRGGVRVDTSREAGFTTDEVLTRALERMTVQKMATTAIIGLRNAAS